MKLREVARIALGGEGHLEEPVAVIPGIGRAEVGKGQARQVDLPPLSAQSEVERQPAQQVEPPPAPAISTRLAPASSVSAGVSNSRMTGNGTR